MDAARVNHGIPQRRWAMEKRLTCRAMGFNCAFVVRAETEEEIDRKMGEHFKAVHSVEFTEELRKKANDLIRLVGA
jgi:predicted small metal-binding protein